MYLIPDNKQFDCIQCKHMISDKLRYRTEHEINL